MIGSTLIQKNVPPAAFLSAGLAIVVALVFARAGLDLLDEGFFLAAIAAPAAYIVSGSFFGEFYHFFYELFDGSIVGIRVLNVLLTYSLAFALCWIVGGRWFAAISRDGFARLVAASTFAAASLLILSAQGQWTATPSYNSLALAGCLIAAIGVVLWCSPEPESLAGSVLVGVGGWVAFMGKPTTALLLAAVTLVLLLASRRWKVKGFLVALGVAGVLVVLSAYAVSGSMAQFVERLSLTMKFIELQQTGHDVGSVVSRLGHLPTGPRALAIYFVAGIFLCFTWWAGAKHASFAVGLVFGAVFLAALGVQIAGIGVSYAKQAFIQMMLMASFVLAAVLMAVAHRFKPVVPDARGRIALGIYMLLMPHVYAFGTNHDYLAQASSAGFFWVLGAALIASAFVTPAGLWPALSKFSLASAVFTLFVLLIAAESPPRQKASLRYAKVPVALGAEGGPVWLEPRQAQFLEDVKSGFRNAAFPSGQRVIDLSGRSHGILYAAGARGVGSAWLAGGGSNSQAVRMLLNQVPCEQLAHAWVLTGVSADKISPAVLEEFGASMEANYQRVAEWTNPNDGDRPALYRPLRAPDLAAAECRRIRGGVAEARPSPAAAPVTSP